LGQDALYGQLQFGAALVHACQLFGDYREFVYCGQLALSVCAQSSKLEISFVFLLSFEE